MQRLPRVAFPLLVAVAIGSTTSAQQRPMFFSDAEHLASLSAPGFEAKPDISDDRLTLLFASDQGNAAGDLDLFMTQRASLDAPFGLQMRVNELNYPDRRDHTPTTSGDGLLIVYSSERPGTGTDDAWTSTRPDVNSPWDPPTEITQLNSPLRDMGFSMTPDGLCLYMSSNRGGGKGNFDLYMSTRPDRSAPWSDPVPIPELNTPFDDKFPSVAGDNLTIYFASDRPGSLTNPAGGQVGDLWCAMRSSVDEPWQVVENVFELNTNQVDYLMSVSNDHQEMFFVSDRPGGFGSLDLYRTEAIPGVTRYGTGTPGFADVPRVRPIGGEPTLGNLGWGMEITNVSPDADGFFMTNIVTGPGPILVGLGNRFVMRRFQRATGSNPPAEVPRQIRYAIRNDPAFIGVTIYGQVLMRGDVFGLGSFNGARAAFSPGISWTVMP